MKLSAVGSTVSCNIIVAIILVISGCGQSKKTDQWTQPPVLAEGAVESIKLMIDGNSIEDEIIAAKAGGRIRLSVTYLRASKEAPNFDSVYAFVTKADPDNGQICSVKQCFLGDTSTERRTGAKISWTSRNEKKGAEGIPVTMNLPPGDYSVWFCGCRSPQTANELRSQQENPWTFRTAFHRCKLRLNEP